MFILDHLLHICQVRRCVRKMRKIQVDVSSLSLCIRCRVEVRGGAPRSFASYLGTCDKLCWICSGSGMGAPASSSATPSSSSPSLTPAPTTPANSPSHGCPRWHHGPHPPGLTLVSRGLLLPSRPLRGR